MYSNIPNLLTTDIFDDLEKIKLCKNDVDRVKLSLSDIDESRDITSEFSYGKKSSEESEKFRYAGNLLLNSSSPDLEEVLKLYSKSILHAPPGSEQLSLAYGNRSAVLFRGEYYEECLEDISRALEIGYPDSLKPKLLIRRVTCNYALTGNVDFEADESLIEARGLIEKLPATNKIRKMVEETLKYPEKITSFRQQVKKIRPKYQPQMKGRNPHLPGASDAIALRYSEKFGRHLVATRDIKSGEVLLIQRPYAMIVPVEWIYCICSHCAKGSWNGIPCDYCIHVMFCSAECKHTAWQQYHDIECEVLAVAKMIGLWDHILMGLRITVKAIKEAGNLEALRKRLEKLDSLKASDVEIPIDPNSYETFYIMSDNPERHELKRLYFRSLIAGRLTYFLAVRTNLFGEREVGDSRVIKNSEKLLFAAGLMSRNMRIASTRALGLKVEEIIKREEDRIIMLIPVYGYLNSRCYDAAEVLRFDENTILVTPVPITKGDQVFTCYCMDYRQAPRDLRRRALKNQWQFVCNCLACTEDWSLSPSAWKNLQFPQEILFDLLHEIQGFKWPNAAEITDSIELISTKDNICKLIDFMYPRVEKPCISVEQFVHMLNVIFMRLSSTIFPRFVDKS